MTTKLPPEDEKLNVSVIAEELHSRLNIHSSAPAVRNEIEKTLEHVIEEAYERGMEDGKPLDDHLIECEREEARREEKFKTLEWVKHLYVHNSLEEVPRIVDKYIKIFSPKPPLTNNNKDV